VRRPRVDLLTTGGTVATKMDELAGRSQPMLDAARISRLAAVPDVDLRVREVSREASWRLDPAQMMEIAKVARDAAHDASTDGVVVAHGTTTLEYTAFLADLTLDGSTPVVFTGAMRRADDAAPDGPRNLRDGVMVAASAETRGLGSLVVFAGRIMAARTAWKAQRQALDAFVDLAGDVGRIEGGEVTILRRPPRRTPLAAELSADVALIKAVPGNDGRSIAGLMSGGIRGLVVEGLPGVGGIPPGMHAELEAAARTIPVVVASRAPYGQLPDVVSGGTGEPLAGLGLISAGDLTAEHAWLLLMVILGQRTDLEDVRTAFAAATAVDGDADAASGQAEEDTA
jgi:L-asparaginase